MGGMREVGYDDDEEDDNDEEEDYYCVSSLQCISTIITRV